AGQGRASSVGSSGARRTEERSRNAPWTTPGPSAPTGRGHASSCAVVDRLDRTAGDDVGRAGGSTAGGGDCRAACPNRGRQVLITVLLTPKMRHALLMIG